MRDDIHRRLPLSRPWKRVVKACARDADEGERGTLATQALGSELQELRPSVLRAGHDALAANQHTLFPGESFHVPCEPRTPIEAAFLRECAAVAQQRRPAAEATSDALVGALHDRWCANEREIRAQALINTPRDCPELLSRLGAAACAVDLRGLAERHLAGETAPRATPRALDLDADLRGSRR